MKPPQAGQRQLTRSRIGAFGACRNRFAVPVAAALVALTCSLARQSDSVKLIEVSTERPADGLSQTSLPGIAAAIRARLAIGAGPVLDKITRVEQTELSRLYTLEAHAPLWVDATRRPSHQARQALTLLHGVRADGLDPGTYDCRHLDQLAAVLEGASAAGVQDVSAFDVGLSTAMLRYFRHLHLGRIDPRAMGFGLNAPADSHDFVALLRAAVANDRIPQTAADLAPPLVQYRALRLALAQYRSLAARESSDVLPVGPTLHPGEEYPDLRLLRCRLVALGDLAADAAMPGDTCLYDGPVVEALKRFQIRHGLEPDGVLGPRTAAALRIPLASRVRQIELALERLRWLPDLDDRRFIALNIPMFQFWAWDSIPPTGEPTFGMRAIVGRGRVTQTPIFVGEMRYIVFRPYWNVPRSILINEILPALERDGDYLRRQDMEIVRGAGDDAAPVANTAENRAWLKSGSLRLRQRPGTKNALGLIKFVFPNDADVYMHGTPAPELFGRTRRDFSHGCVRVEDPVALAAWVLNDAGWDRDRILAAMTSTSQRVDLKDPIQVILFYVTAVVKPTDATIHFAADIYGHDVKLDRALSRLEAASK
jgi:murein L,D-transpeptidase YcbB/YkuD